MLFTQVKQIGVKMTKYVKKLGSNDIICDNLQDLT